MGRGTDTRERILAEARRLFAEKGYDGATIADIARQADITDGAIYRHFSDKRDLFLACVGPVVEEGFTRSLAEVRMARDLPAMVRSLVRIRLEMLERDADAFNILFTEAPYHPELRLLLLDRVKAQVENTGPLFKRLMDEGLTERRPNILILGLGLTVLMWSILGFRNELDERITGRPLTMENLTDELSEFVLYGIAGVPAGRNAVPAGRTK
ncbi:MAG: TetR/AcrR family transcriptional regulator [Methanocella sp.]